MISSLHRIRTRSCFSGRRSFSLSLLRTNDIDTRAAFLQLKSTYSGEKINLSPEVEAELNAAYSEFMADESTLNSARISKAKDETTAKSTSAQDTGNIHGNVEFPRVLKSQWNQPYSKQELYLRRRFFAQSAGKLGAHVEEVYRPHNDLHKPPSVRETSLATLLAAGAHLGHSTSRLRPSTQPFIYGVRDDIHLIDLEQTLVSLRRACSVVEGIAKRGGVIVFLGTLPGLERALQFAAKRAGAYYVHTRWIPGTLTNATEISPQWERTELDMGDNESGRELSSKLLRTIVKPDVVVILNPVENRNALRECMQCKVPTIGIIDTDSEPSLVTYPIPANDDSIRTSELILGVLSKAGEKGRASRHAQFSDYKRKVAELNLEQ